jgi:hypothetical protein
MVATSNGRTQPHLQALHTSSILTARWYRMYRPEATMYEPEAVIRLLNKAKVKFVVMGTHGIGGWRSEPRSTHDVDVLVTLKDCAKAVQVIHQAYPELEMVHWKAVTRFKDKRLGYFVIDVMEPVDALYKAAFKYSVPVGKSHRVPDLEMALASKYAAMISNSRHPKKKFVDAGDFIDMVEHNLPDIDTKKLKRLANKVYSKAGDEILKMIEDIKAGRPIKI